MQKWSCERVIDEMHRWNQSGRPMNRVWTENRCLFRAAVSYFGNWTKAMKAAGLDFNPRRRWSRKKVVKELMAWHENPFTGTLRRHDAGLAAAATSYFGSVAKALEELDLDSKDRLWSDKKIVRYILDGFMEGRSLRIAGFGETAFAALVKRRFGSWQNALEVAGLGIYAEPSRVCRSWSKEAVIMELRRWHEEHRSLRKVHQLDTGLYSVAKHLFGSWRNALAAAGLSSTHRQWTREKVIAGLRQFHSQGIRMTSGSLYRHDQCLAAAAIRLFGGWHPALEAAEIPIPSNSIVRRRARNRGLAS